MDLKDFFKPTKEKRIIFLLIILIALLFALLMRYNAPECYPQYFKCTPNLTSLMASFFIFLIALWPFLVIEKIQSIIPYFLSNIFYTILMIIGFILSVIYIYFMACLIYILLYKKKIMEKEEKKKSKR
jgi:hypothetical protein